MKQTLCKSLLLASLAITPTARAEINVPSDGSDGVFAPLTNVVIDLSQAVTGVWDQNNSAHAGRGIYDPEKWAVVFKFESVNIPTNVTVTFMNHASRAPVVWLVQSNVVIDGVVSLNGADASEDASLANLNQEGGPGGFRGGLGGNAYPSGAVALGPVNGYLSDSYANAQLVPLIGGTGRRAGTRGPSGGGAILIATRADIIVDGQVSAVGGTGSYPTYAPASGGGIRLLAQDVRGGGTFPVGYGRFRLDSVTHHLTNPGYADSFQNNPGTNLVIWPGADAPKVRIISIAGTNTPAEPMAALNGYPDLTIATNQAVPVMIETLHFPVEGNVTLRLCPKYSDAVSVGASYVGGNFDQALWRAEVNFPSAYSVMQVRAFAP